MRLTKWIKLYQNPNYKPPTLKQLEKRKIREQKIMKELYESDFHEITWERIYLCSITLPMFNL
jgi:hypothetical protein